MTPAQHPPLLGVIMDALRERGWTITNDGTLIDPQGNPHVSVESAITTQTLREIAAA